MYWICIKRLHFCTPTKKPNQNHFWYLKPLFIILVRSYWQKFSIHLFLLKYSLQWRDSSSTDIIDFLLHNFTKLRCSYSLFLQPFLVILAILAALPSITSSLNLCLTWDKNCMQHCRWNLTYSFNNGTNASLTTESIKHF